MTNNGYIILVEGQADLTFIRDVLKYLNKNLTSRHYEDNRELRRITLSDETTKITLYSTMGYTRIPKIAENIKPYIEKGRKLLIIFDADRPETQGGFKKRREQIIEIVKEHLEIELEATDIFLFPDNKSDGDLEDLLLQLVDKQLYDPFVEPFLKYAETIKELPKKLNNEKIKKTFHKEISSRKNRIFNYFQVYQGKTKAKESGRDYLTKEGLWNFDADALKPLIEFFNKNLNF